MIINGYHCQIKDKQVRNAVIYIILLISLDGRKKIGSWHIEFGRENRIDWIRIFNDLISRGLKSVLVIVSDDFPGLSETVNAVFPKIRSSIMLATFCKEFKEEYWEGRL